jgi:hypothetical protein
VNFEIVPFQTHARPVCIVPYASLFANSSTDALVMSTSTDSAVLLVSAPLNAGTRTVPSEAAGSENPIVADYLDFVFAASLSLPTPDRML